MNIDRDNLEAIIKCYVLDQLSDDETQEFEVYFLSRPEVADLVDSAQKLHAGLRVSRADSKVGVEPVASVDPPVTESFWRMIRRMFSGSVPASAMAIMLVMASPLIIKGIATNEHSQKIELVSLESALVRSSSPSDGIDLSTAEGAAAAVVVRVKEVSYPSYSLSISLADSNKEIWRSAPFQFASGERDSLVVIPAKAALDGVNVELYGRHEDGREEKVTFCNYTDSCF